MNGRGAKDELGAVRELVLGCHQNTDAGTVEEGGVGYVRHEVHGIARDAAM
jgi:hypothetical protein